MGQGEIVEYGLAVYQRSIATSQVVQDRVILGGEGELGRSGALDELETCIHSRGQGIPIHVHRMDGSRLDVGDLATYRGAEAWLSAGE